MRAHSQARPACRGLDVNPSLDSSCLRGTLAVSRPRWRPTLASPPARRGVCHQLLQVNSPGRQRAGPPWQGGRLLPIVLGRVWPSACWKRANTPKLSLVSTYVTAAYLVAQPKPEVPKHLSLPGPGGPRRPSEPRWGGSSKGRTAQPGPGEHGQHRGSMDPGTKKPSKGRQNLEVLCCGCYFSIN